MITVKCPYCGETNKFRFEPEGLVIVHCDLDSGGCDMPFAMEAEKIVTYETKVYSLIEKKEK